MMLQFCHMMILIKHINKSALSWIRSHVTETLLLKINYENFSNQQPQKQQCSHSVEDPLFYHLFSEMSAFFTDTLLHIL